jgi:hypothetical protein
MPIFDDSILDTQPGSAGPRTGFFEGLQSGFDQAFRVDSQQSLDTEIFNRWNENLELLEASTQQQQQRVSLDAINFYVRRRDGEEVKSAAQLNEGGNFLTGFFGGAREENFFNEEDIALINQQSAALQAAGLPGFDEIFQEVVDLQRQIEQTSSDVSQRGGAGAFTGQLVGGIGGSFTTRDPLLLMSAFAGGVGRNAAVRIATEAGVAGGVEAAIQFGPVARNRELAGLGEGNPLQNVLLAAGGAAALRGLFEGAGAGVRRLRGEATPEVSLDFEDAQLRQFLGERPQSPNARAALDLLDDDAAIAAASPYGTSYPALRRFTAEVAQAELALLGRTDTAIGRAFPDIPLANTERAADFEIVRVQSPEIAGRFDAAQARVAELDNRITAVGEELEARTVLDAVRLVDEEAAEQLAQLAARTMPEEARALEADIIFTRVGKERILRAAEDAEIAPRKETQRLRAQRRAANKELRLAAREMEAERVKLTAAADKIKSMMQGETTDLLGYALATRPPQGSKLATERVVAQREAIAKDADTLPDRAGDALTASLTPEAGPVKVAELKEGMGEMGKAIADGFITMLFARARKGEVTDVNGTTLPALQALKMISDAGVKLTRELAERVIRNTDRLTSTGDQFSADMRSIVLDEINVAQGLLEIAPGIAVRADFLIPNEAGELVPIGPLIKDFDEDARLVEAMRSCAL